MPAMTWHFIKDAPAIQYTVTVGPIGGLVILALVAACVILLKAIIKGDDDGKK